MHGLVLIILVVLLICIAPWLLFWSIGQLFGFHIEFGFWNVIAAYVLLGLVRGGNK